MPRPKGSKNKKTAVDTIVNEINYEELITAAEAEIAALTADLKVKKAELKKLVKAKEKADKEAAEKKAEADKQAILAAIEASGKSVEEILELLK